MDRLKFIHEVRIGNSQKSRSSFGNQRLILPTKTKNDPALALQEPVSDNIEDLLKSRTIPEENPPEKSPSSKTINLEEEMDAPDFEKLKSFLQTYYKTKEDGTPYSFKDALKSAWSGSIFDSLSPKAEEKSLFDQAGPGLRLYFNFMNLLILYFLFSSIISIPMQIFNIGNHRYHASGSGSNWDQNQTSGFFVGLLNTFAATSLKVNLHPFTLFLTNIGSAELRKQALWVSSSCFPCGKNLKHYWLLWPEPDPEKSRVLLPKYSSVVSDRIHCVSES